MENKRWIRETFDVFMMDETKGEPLASAFLFSQPDAPLSETGTRIDTPRLMGHGDRGAGR